MNQFVYIHFIVLYEDLQLSLTAAFFFVNFIIHLHHLIFSFLEPFSFFSIFKLTVHLFILIIFLTLHFFYLNWLKFYLFKQVVFY
jgi:hypothetical protein